MPYPQRCFTLDWNQSSEKIFVSAKIVKIRVDKKLVVAAYADDLVIMAEDEANLKDIKWNLNGKKIGLGLNENNTKYTITAE